MNINKSMAKKSLEKTLSIKRVYAYAIYNALRSVPPKDYPTTGEIKITISDILPAFKEHIGEYLEMFKKAQEVSVKVQAKEMTEEAAKEKVNAVNSGWKKYNDEHGSEMVGISFDSETFTVLKEQFNRDKWGSQWLANIEEYGELLEAFSKSELPQA